MAAATDSRGGIRAVSDEEILTAYRLLAAREGMFCEPASAASVAGLLKYGPEGAEQIVCVLTGRGLKDPETAIANNDGEIIQCVAETWRSRKRCWVIRRRGVRCACPRLRPTSGRFRLHGGGARAAAGGRGRRDRAVLASNRAAGRQGPRQPHRAAFERLHPADGFALHDPLGDPARGGARVERGGDRRGADGGRPPVRARRRPAGGGHRARGSPRQRRGRAPRRVRGVRRRAARRAWTRRRGLEALAVVPDSRCAPSPPGRRCPRRCRSPTRSSTSPTPRCSTLGLARGDWDLVARGLQDRLHQQRRAHLFPRSFELAAARASWGRSGRRSPGPGRPCWCGASTSRPASWPRRWHRRWTGGRG